MAAEEAGNRGDRAAGALVVESERVCCRREIESADRARGSASRVDGLRMSRSGRVTEIAAGCLLAVGCDLREEFRVGGRGWGKRLRVGEGMRRGLG